MRRLPAMLASACTAVLATLAITVAVPAIADNGPDAKTDDALAACLRAHGLSGVPDDAALKPWLGKRLHRNDATAMGALKACAPPKVIVDRGPSEQQIRSCLKDHGVEAPSGDGRALKRWLFEHGDDPANRDALKACDMAPMTKPEAGEACGKGRVVEPATKDEPTM